MKKIDYFELGHVLESIHPGVTIADAEGVFVFVSQSYLNGRDVSGEDILGKNALSEEMSEIFSPCVTRLVLEKGERVTTVQKGTNNEEIFVTGIPVYSDGKLEMIISYSSWEITGFDDLRERYHILEYQNQKLLKEIDRLVRRDSMDAPFIAESRRAKTAERLIRIFCEADCPSFIYGPAGCGKNFMAGMVYGECGMTYSYDCSFLSEETIQRELLGEDSIISSGSGIRAVIIQNIDKLTPQLQRIFTEKFRNSKIIPVGISEYSLDELKANGMVTEEFFHMFEAYQVQIYAVNERSEDIISYIEYYLTIFNKKYSRNVYFTSRARNCLLGYEWKGNIDEIKHTIERIVLTAENPKADLYCLPEKITGNSSLIFTQNASLKDMMEFYEKGLIVQAYEKYGTTVAVAENLGISQATAVRKIQKYISQTREKQRVSSGSSSHPENIPDIR